MPDDKKVKTIRNPERNKPSEYKAYIPQYQIEGKEPGLYSGGVVPGAKIARPNADNPRLKRAPIRQPYAEATVSPIGAGRSPVLNVGNNMEHTWSSVDGEIVDDISNEGIDPNHPMIDNNDFVTDEALGFRNGITADELQSQYVMQPPVAFEQEVESVHKPASSEDLMPVVADLEEEAYLLIVGGTPICSGPKEQIEEQAGAFVFGEHEMCDGNPVPIDDIIILKRVKVKVGLFLE